MTSQNEISIAYLFDDLKMQVALKLGFVVNSKPDCARLSQLIAAEGHGYISESTIYRMFLQPSKHQPYKHTLNIICSFLGYPSFEQYLTLAESRMGSLNDKSFQIYKSQNQLLLHCINTASFKPLELFFEGSMSESEEVKEQIAVELYDALLSANETSSFFKHFAQNQFVRTYFFEKAFDPAFRIPNYDLGIRYYAEGLAPSESSQALQDYLFAYAVLFRHYFFKKDMEQTILIGEKLYKAISPSSTDLERVHLFPRMRYLCYKIWYDELTGVAAYQIEDYFDTCLSEIASQFSIFDKFERRVIFHNMAEAIVHSSTLQGKNEALKHLFKDEFEHVPEMVFRKTVDQVLPYFEPNGLMIRRPQHRR